MFRYQNQFCAPLVFTKGKKERVGILIFTNTDELWGGGQLGGVDSFPRTRQEVFSVSTFIYFEFCAWNLNLADISWNLGAKSLNFGANSCKVCSKERGGAGEGSGDLWEVCSLMIGAGEKKFFLPLVFTPVARSIWDHFPKDFFTNNSLPTRFQVVLYLISNGNYFVSIEELVFILRHTTSGLGQNQTSQVLGKESNSHGLRLKSSGTRRLRG